MKNYIKKTWISYVIALTISYMLFIFEPIQMYAGNINDFLFNFKTLIGPTLLAFTGLFAILVILFNIIYFINKKAFKLINVIAFIAFICTYIQGNYLVGNLPVLDGTAINWSNYKLDMIISALLWLIVIIVSIILCKKKTLDNYIKYSGYITLAIFAMLSVSFLTTILTTPVLTAKNSDYLAVVTDKNINKYSSNENFIIFLLDAVDSKYFEKAMKEDTEKASILKDFTYYPDTMSMFPFTQESVPQILTNKVFQNEVEYSDYFIDAMNNSPLINYLYDNKYDINIYEPEFPYNDIGAEKISNVVNYHSKDIVKINTIDFIKNEMKYDLFRYLPFFLKKYSKIEKLNFLNSRSLNDIKTFTNNGTVEFVNYFDNQTPEISEQKNFKFIHLTGAHVGFTFDKNLNPKKDAKYIDEVEGCLTLTNKYLNYLKDNKLYDNSNIIVMADHGFAMNKKGIQQLIGRQNPILFIKGINETHDKMNVSEKQISYDDLNSAYTDLFNKKSSEELFSDINTERTRRYLLYEYTKENHMTEYETKGKAWETDKLYKTGKEFNR